jgi:hypothetical protein
MSSQVLELEALLRQLIAEHRRLLTHVEKHATAMKVFDLKIMNDEGRNQEAARMRIGQMDGRRRLLVQQISRAANAQGELPLRKLAALFPQRTESLMALRLELKEVVEKIANRTRISGKVASAVLGHLNTVVRLLSGAVERAGLYTKQGIPRASARIGMMERVG